MKGRIEITLKSNLCAGTGYAYAGVIDQDTAVNKNGLPYIPARRLKGCLLEAAKMIGIPEKDCSRIFGIRGDSKSGTFRIGNAALKDSEAVDAACAALIQKKAITRNDVADVFTAVLAQTAVDGESGTADPTSLRFTRVCSHYSPVDGQEQVFYAPVTFADEDQTVLVDIVHALRNIGMHRNRGLGSVRCELKPDPDSEGSTEFTGTGNVLRVVFRNEEPLVLSGSDDRTTQPYISARALIGALAAEYARKHKDTADFSEDPDFRNLFLNGSTVYTNAYPAVYADKKYCRTQPAPMYLNEYKKSKKLVNLLAEDNGPADPDYQPEGGNQPKPLRGKFICRTAEDTYAVKETETSIVYHHSGQPAASGRPGMLYTSEAVNAGQYFETEIRTSCDHDRQILEDLLKSGQFLFGKSKSAQYGLASVVSAERKVEEEKETYTGKIAVTLLSDGIFAGDHGYTNCFAEVSSLIAEELNLSVSSLTDPLSRAQACEVTGYYTKWNLRRQALPGIQAGSSFIYELKEPAELPAHAMLGENNTEGYGEVQIEKIGTMARRPKDAGELPSPLKQNPAGTNLIHKILCDKLMDELLKNYMKSESRNGLGGAQLGRVTLMLRESMEKHSMQTGKTDDIIREFRNRIESIKTDKTRETALKFVSDHRNLPGNYAVKTDFAAAGWKAADAYQEILPQYLMNLLTYEKYKGKDAGK